MFADLAPHCSTVTPSRYGARRTVNVWAIAAVALLHTAVIGALLHVRSEHGKVAHHALTVVDLTPPATPPPPDATPAPQEPASQTAPPLPMTEVAQTAPMQIAIVDPLPEPAPIIAAPPAPPAPPAQSSFVQARDLGTRVLSAIPPRYPTESRRKREQGTVVLSIVLSVEGEVSSISVAHSSGYSRLDEAAQRAVRKWRWAPTIRDGIPVMVRGLVEIPFILQG